MVIMSIVINRENCSKVMQIYIEVTRSDVEPRVEQQFFGASSKSDSSVC